MSSSLGCTPIFLIRRVCDMCASALKNGQQLCNHPQMQEPIRFLVCTVAVSITKISKQLDQSSIHHLNQLGSSQLASAITTSCLHPCHHNTRASGMLWQPIESCLKRYSLRPTYGKGVAVLAEISKKFWKE